VIAPIRNTAMTPWIINNAVIMGCSPNYDVFELVFPYELKRASSRMWNAKFAMRGALKRHSVFSRKEEIVWRPRATTPTAQ
jgi:hypothetical protein